MKSLLFISKTSFTSELATSTKTVRWTSLDSVKVMAGNSDKISITEPDYFRDLETKKLGVPEEFAEDFRKYFAKFICLQLQTFSIDHLSQTPHLFSQWSSRNRLHALQQVPGTSVPSLHPQAMKMKMKFEPFQPFFSWSVILILVKFLVLATLLITISVSQSLEILASCL